MLLTAYHALGQGSEGLGSLRHIQSTREPVVADEAPADSWGSVPTEKTSLINVAPVLLPFFNNGTVFGVPGTVTGDFWDRTQLTGAWGGLRTDLASNGLFVDVYSTSVYQDVASGGLRTGSSFTQNIQTSINLDTGRAGLWSGGLFHFTLQSRYGSSPQDTFTVGASVPQYMGLLLPGPLFTNNTLPSEYFFVQALGTKFSVLFGKISDIFIPDQTLFADSYKYYFANFNFNLNPLTANTYNPTSIAALAVWTPVPWLTTAQGVLDPNTQADNLATNAFDHVNLYWEGVASYKIGELPGQFAPAFNWSNKPKMDLASPFGPLAPGQIPQAVGALIGSPLTGGLPINFANHTLFVIANLSQYLLVLEDSEAIAEAHRTGQVLHGAGVFARAGWGPQDSNPITGTTSAGLFVHGLLARRKYDSFGLGYYYNFISNDLKNDVAQLTAGTASVRDEQGIEVFYSLAITPAIRMIASYQHIWDPLAAQVATNQRWADIILARVTVAW